MNVLNFSVSLKKIFVCWLVFFSVIETAFAYWLPDKFLDESITVSFEEFSRTLDEIHREDPANRENLYNLGTLNIFLSIKDLDRVTVFKYRPQRLFHGRRNSIEEWPPSDPSRMEYLRKAIDFYEQARKFSQNGDWRWMVSDEDIGLKIGWCYQQINRKAEAIGIYQQIIRKAYLAMKKGEKMDMDPEDAMVAIERMTKLLDPGKDASEIKFLGEFVMYLPIWQH